MKFGISIKPSSSALSGVLLFFGAEALAGKMFAFGLAAGYILCSLIVFWEDGKARKKDSDND